MTSVSRLTAALTLGCLIAFSGCSGSTSSSGSTTTTPPTTTTNSLTAGGASTVFVGQTNGLTCGTIDEFSISTSTSATTSAAPATTLALPSSNGAFVVAADTTGQLYVACSAPHQIFIYAAGASGSATPVRTITVANSNFIAGAISVDSTGQIYVLDESGTGAVYVYGSGASGTTAPLRTIAGPATGMTNTDVTDGMAVDPSGNVYVSVITGGVTSILAFAANANGNVAPVRDITSTAAGNMQGGPIATDASGDLYAAYSTFATGYTVAEFSPTANGVATPTRIIAGSATGLAGIGSIRLDTVGNIYVYTGVANTTNEIVEAFASTASGNVAPAVQLTYSLLGLAPLNSLAVK